jgi:predicted DNA binding CopG/RHH family protein
MYTKDKSIRITLRLNENQFDFVKYHSDCLGVSPSEFLRMVINSTMSLTNDGRAVNGRENDETDIDNFI